MRGRSWHAWLAWVCLSIALISFVHFWRFCHSQKFAEMRFGCAEAVDAQGRGDGACPRNGIGPCLQRSLWVPGAFGTVGLLLLALRTSMAEQRIGRKATGWAWILIVATVMASGVLFLSRTYTPLVVFPASWITWSVLGWRLENRTNSETVFIGILSPILGALIASGLLLAGMLARIPEFRFDAMIESIGMLAFGSAWVLVKLCWYIFPIGIIAAFTIRRMWRYLPPNHSLLPPRTGAEH